MICNIFFDQVYLSQQPRKQKQDSIYFEDSGLLSFEAGI